jgi:hypothetical protein
LFIKASRRNSPDFPSNLIHSYTKRAFRGGVWLLSNPEINLLSWHFKFLKHLYQDKNSLKNFFGGTNQGLNSGL